MGKGDKKSRKGKIAMGSYGVTRPRKKSKPALAAKNAGTKKAAAPKKVVAPKKAAAKPARAAVKKAPTKKEE